MTHTNMKITELKDMMDKAEDLIIAMNEAGELPDSLLTSLYYGLSKLDQACILAEHYMKQKVV